MFSAYQLRTPLQNRFPRPFQVLLHTSVLSPWEETCQGPEGPPGLCVHSGPYELQAFRSSASTEEQMWWGSVLGGEASWVEVLSLGCTWNPVFLLQGEAPWAPSYSLQAAGMIALDIPRYPEEDSSVHSLTGPIGSLLPSLLIKNKMRTHSHHTSVNQSISKEERTLGQGRSEWPKLMFGAYGSFFLFDVNWSLKDMGLNCEAPLTCAAYWITRSSSTWSMPGWSCRNTDPEGQW